MRYVAFVLLGGAAHWIPDVFAHLALLEFKISPMTFWWTVLVLPAPLVVISVWTWIKRTAIVSLSPRAAPLLMLLGIWMLGSPALGFEMMDPFAPFGYPVHWIMFPLTTPLQAAYTGSIFGLVLSSIFLIGATIAAHRRLRAQEHRQLEATNE